MCAIVNSQLMFGELKQRFNNELLIQLLFEDYFENVRSRCYLIWRIETTFIIMPTSQ